MPVRLPPREGLLRRAEVRLFYAVTDALDPEPEGLPAPDPLPDAEAALADEPRWGRLAFRAGLRILEGLGWLLRARSFAWLERAGRRGILRAAGRVPLLRGPVGRVRRHAEAALEGARGGGAGQGSGGRPAGSGRPQAAGPPSGL